MIVATAAIARRELRALLRSGWAIVLTLAIPLLVATIIGAGFPTVPVLETDAPFQTSRVAQGIALEIVIVLGFAIYLRTTTVFAARREEGRLRRLRRLRFADTAIMLGLIVPILAIAMIQLFIVAGGTLVGTASTPSEPLYLAIAAMIAPLFFVATGILMAAFTNGAETTPVTVALPLLIVVVGALWVLLSAGTANALHLGVPGAGIAELVRLAWTNDLPRETISAAAGRAAGSSLLWTAIISAAAWRFFRWEPQSR